MNLPPHVIVMGVTACGKSTLAEGLAATLGARFIEADNFHPAPNIAKMASGIPLTDADRLPWLNSLATQLAREPRTGVVMSCSALRKKYRDILRTSGHLQWVYLEASEAEINARIAIRQGHFMSPLLVSSQFSTLEPPTPDEEDVFTLPANLPASELLRLATEALHRR